MTFKEKRKFNKMMRTIKRNLRKCIRKWNVFDFYHSFNLFVECLKGMQEYYKNGINVVAAEIEGHNRLDNITKAIDFWKLYSMSSFEEGEKYFNSFCDVIKQESQYWWD